MGEYIPKIINFRHIKIHVFVFDVFSVDIRYEISTKTKVWSSSIMILPTTYYYTTTNYNLFYFHIIYSWCESWKKINK